MYSLKDKSNFVVDGSCMHCVCWNSVKIPGISNGAGAGDLKIRRK